MIRMFLFLVTASGMLAFAGLAQSLSEACIANDAEACIALADVRKSSDPADAARYYGVACDGGSAYGCFKLGDMFAQGRGLTLASILPPATLARIDQADAVAATTTGAHVVSNVSLSSRCAAGHMEDCFDLANLLKFGDKGIQQNLYRAASLYAQTCRSGMMPGCSGLAQMFHFGWGVKENPGSALRIYTKACGAGNHQGCVGVGRIFSGGRNADRQLAHEVKMSRIACDRHMTSTCWQWD